MKNLLYYGALAAGIYWAVRACNQVPVLPSVLATEPEYKTGDKVRFIFLGNEYDGVITNISENMYTIITAQLFGPEQLTKDKIITKL